MKTKPLANHCLKCPMNSEQREAIEMSRLSFWKLHPLLACRQSSPAVALRATQERGRKKGDTQQKGDTQFSAALSQKLGIRLCRKLGTISENVSSWWPVSTTSKSPKDVLREAWNVASQVFPK